MKLKGGPDLTKSAEYPIQLGLKADKGYKGLFLIDCHDEIQFFPQMTAIVSSCKISQGWIYLE